MAQAYHTHTFKGNIFSYYRLNWILGSSALCYRTIAFSSFLFFQPLILDQHRKARVVRLVRLPDSILFINSK